MSVDPVKNPASEPLPSAAGAGSELFKWTCLAFAVVFLALLTWLVNDAREQTRRLHEEVRRVREDFDRSRPTLILQGELNPLAHSDKLPDAISVPYHPAFAAPPQLTFPDGHAGWEITFQKADSFTLNRDRSTAGNGQKLKWKAQGRPAKARDEEQSEAIQRLLGAILTELRVQGNARRSENTDLQREVQLLRELEKKRLDSGKK